MITAPSDGATVAGIVTITANASDDVGVVGVQFLLDGVTLGAEKLQVYRIDVVGHHHSIRWSLYIDSKST